MVAEIERLEYAARLSMGTLDDDTHAVIPHANPRAFLNCSYYGRLGVMAALVVVSGSVGFFAL